MPNPKTGQYIDCPYCGTPFYKKRSDDKFKKRVTCGKPECKSAHFTGINNHFWGRKHSPESLAKMREKRAQQPNVHNSKGYRHKPEAKAKMSAALKARWAERRDFMMANLPRGKDHHWKKDAEFIRHRSHFSPLQRREWKDTSCAWCSTSDDLVLDHIIPVVAGGPNDRVNCQTLCQTCNLWKMWFVDRPLTIAMKATTGASE